ncbi:hypothetical protein ACFRI7_20715 [Streptomyces sp. NPDC056716]
MYERHGGDGRLFRIHGRAQDEEAAERPERGESRVEVHEQQ